MSTPAVTQPVESVTTPAFNPSDQHTWSSEQRETWNKTGDIPAAKQDSAPAKKEAVADSAPPKEEKAADSASDSATDKNKPHLKTKEDTEKRFQELLETNKALQRRLESLERGKPSETRDTKQDPQPAPDNFKRLDEKEYFAKNPKATYEDFVDAAAEHRAKYLTDKAIREYEANKVAQAAQKELSTRVDEAKKRYPDYEETVKPAVESIVTNQQIPFAVKAILNDSPVFADLMYVLGQPDALKDLIQTAQTNPAAAIRKIVLTEQLVQAELAKGKDKTEESKRDESGKFVSEKKAEVAEPKPRAPKPPSEVGGRGTAAEDALVAAAKGNDFKSFEAEEWRRKRASRS